MSDSENQGKEQKCGGCQDSGNWNGYQSHSHGSGNPYYEHSRSPMGYGYGYDSHREHGPASWFNFRNDHYLKGFLMGAAGTFLATNQTVQKSIIKSAIKSWMTVQEGLEELKEQVEDAKAEISVEKKPSP